MTEDELNRILVRIVSKCDAILAEEFRDLEEEDRARLRKKLVYYFGETVNF